MVGEVGVGQREVEVVDVADCGRGVVDDGADGTGTGAGPVLRAPRMCKAVGSTAARPYSGRAAVDLWSPLGAPGQWSLLTAVFVVVRKAVSGASSRSPIW
ncbi:hypothetical protein AB0895_35265, partial [Streptomyces globisporus]|uniref:hypothetical protein n=1 Tax=Streptomyces globisporus TaxID=1908 RepID=UPI00346112EA